MTKAELRNEISKLEEQKINFCDSNVLFESFSNLIDELKRELYKNQPAALKHLGL